MMWGFMSVWAAPVLVLDEQIVEPPTDLDVRLELREGLPWMELHVGALPVTIDWNASMLAAPGEPLGPFFPAESHVFGPDSTTSLPDGTFSAGATPSFVVIPRTWLDDGNSNEKMDRWSKTSFSELRLVVEVGGVRSEHRTLWHTEEQVEEALPLAIPATLPVPADIPRPLPTADVVETRVRWDQSYRTIRQEAQLARTVWWSGLIVGGLGTAGAIREAARAVEGRRAGDDDWVGHQSRATLLGVVGLSALSITIPSALWERNARKRMRGLGRRP